MCIEKQFTGKMYRLGQMDVPVMRVNEEARMVLLSVGGTLVWVRASELEPASRSHTSVRGGEPAMGTRIVAVLQGDNQGADVVHVEVPASVDLKAEYENPQRNEYFNEWLVAKCGGRLLSTSDVPVFGEF
jgi:hypothetical protein